MCKRACMYPCTHECVACTQVIEAIKAPQEELAHLRARMKQVLCVLPVPSHPTCMRPSHSAPCGASGCHSHPTASLSPTFSSASSSPSVPLTLCPCRPASEYTCDASICRINNVRVHIHTRKRTAGARDIQLAAGCGRMGSAARCSSSARCRKSLIIVPLFVSTCVRVNTRCETHSVRLQGLPLAVAP